MNRFLAVGVLMGVVGVAGCSGNGGGTSDDATSLQIEDLTVGTGATAAKGDTINVLYTGTFLDGRVFDSSSLHGNTPFTFQLGARRVIPGWDQGLVGMRVGGKRKLTIPAALAYGENGGGSIPPNTPLRFEVDLVSIAGK